MGKLEIGEFWQPEFPISNFSISSVQLDVFVKGFERQFAANGFEKNVAVQISRCGFPPEIRFFFVAAFHVAFVLTYKQVFFEGRQSFVFVELAGAVVFLRAFRQHLDDEDRIDEQQVIALPIFRLFAHDQGIGVQTIVELRQVNFLVGTEENVIFSQRLNCRTYVNSGIAGKDVVSSSCVRHFDDFSIVVFVFILAATFHAEVLVQRVQAWRLGLF